MKTTLLICLLVLSVQANAQFNDHDGQLDVSWQAPDFGNPLDHYFWSYEVNSVVDSLTGQSNAQDTLESSMVLATVGDWAIFRIWAVSTFDDTSIVAISDTAYYNPEEGIGPPTGVNWIQGP